MPCFFHSRLPTLAAILLVVGASAAPAAAQRVEDPDTRAVNRALEMARERASADEVAREMQRTFRLSPGQTVVVLHRVRYPAADVAAATARTFGAPPEDLVRHLAAAGVAAGEAASALREGLGLEHREIAVTLRDGIELSPEGIDGALRYAGASPAIAEDALRFAGFVGPAPDPGIHRYWIRDYRPGASPSAIIVNEGIVDRYALGFLEQVQPLPSWEGEVWIEGEALDMPDTEVLVDPHGARPERGEILERTREGGLDRLRVGFNRVPGPGLMVRHSGGEVVHDAVPLLYYYVSRDELADPLEDLSVVLGDPEGTGQIRVGGATVTLELEPHRQSSLEVILTGIRSEPCSVDTGPAPNGAAVTVTIPFSEDGRQFRGHLAAYIPVWACESFEVPLLQCGFLDISCFLDFLGEALESLGTCANPANWREHQVLDLPGAPFEGDLHNASLRIRMEIAADGTGRLRSQNNLYDFQANVSVVGPAGGGVSLAAIEGYLSGSVTRAIARELEDLDLAGELAAAVNGAADAVGAQTGWNIQIRDVSAMSGGALFLDLSR